MTPTEVTLNLDEGEFTDPGATVARQHAPVDAKASPGGTQKSPVLGDTKAGTVPGAMPTASQSNAAGARK